MQRRLLSVRKLVLKVILFGLLIQGVIYAECKLADAILKARPGAKWSLKGNSYGGLDWQDAVRSKPSVAELTLIQDDCMLEEERRVTDKGAAKAILKNRNATSSDRLDALIVMLDMDR